MVPLLFVLVASDSTTNMQHIKVTLRRTPTTIDPDKTRQESAMQCLRSGDRVIRIATRSCEPNQEKKKQTRCDALLCILACYFTRIMTIETNCITFDIAQLTTPVTNRTNRAHVNQTRMDPNRTAGEVCSLFDVNSHICDN